METSAESPTLPAVTVRRNPPRKARATPFSTCSKIPSHSSSCHRQVPSFPIDEILSIQLPNPEPKSSISENLKVYLRIKPMRSGTKPAVTEYPDRKAKPRSKNVWPRIPSKKNKANENRSPEKKVEKGCIELNGPHSVTVTPPLPLQELKRSKNEVYEGFSFVFPEHSTQNEVYEKMVHPLVEDVLRGKSGMLAALGPSGSGKTHTVFGGPGEPGMIPLALRRILAESRLLHLSIFEIYSERGKGERISDLLGGGTAVSSIKNMSEIPVKDLTEAESLVAKAILKRATATTNSNSQSSRSQCVINMRVESDGSANESLGQPNNAVLTIVDLAGAEREKRTGNHGARLLESNFINNTSMVFGLCLRSLLEHQKNPKKTMQKHYKNSLLTRYLRDYLEGKKRMALVLTVKAGNEDYLDTSFLLKQASPYMKIKFDNNEEPYYKRQLLTFATSEQNKRRKLHEKASAAGKASEGGTYGTSKIVPKTLAAETPGIYKADVKNDSTLKDRGNRRASERNYKIMQSFAKAIWNVLKQQNEKLKIADHEIKQLKENLNREQLKNIQLKEELTQLKSFHECSKTELGQEFLLNFLSDSEARGKFAEDSMVNEDPTLLPEDNGFLNVENLYEIQPNPDGLLKPQHPEKPVRSSMVGESSSCLNGCISSLRLGNDIQQDCDDSFKSGKGKKPEPAAKTDAKCEELSDNTHGPESESDLKVEPSDNASEPEAVSDANDDKSSDITCEPEAQSKDVKVDKPSDNASEPEAKSYAKNDKSSDNISEPEATLDVKAPVPGTFMSVVASSVNICSASELSQQSSGQGEDPVMPCAGVEPSGSFNDEACDFKSTPSTSFKPTCATKPKRRLMPASSVLLVRDMNALDLDEETEKPKGRGKGKKSPAGGKLRSKGNMSLLHLLKNC